MDSLARSRVPRAIQTRAIFAISLRRNARPSFWLAGKLPDPVRVASTIYEQHRLWKQGAEENRTQPIALQHFGWKFAERSCFDVATAQCFGPAVEYWEKAMVEWPRLGALSFLLSTLLTSVMFLPLLLFAP